jgi:uncharacterized protein YbaR (Trm112 family)
MDSFPGMLDPDLIPLLRCPATGQALRLATVEEKRGRGIPEEEAALIAEDGARIYRTDMGFPVLLSAKELTAAG